MPDPILALKATAAAAVVAAVVMLVSALLFRKGRSGSATLVEVLAVGGGLGLGCWWLGFAPKVPPIEDRDRLLLVLLPAVGIVEIIAASSRWKWVGRILRVLLALPIPFLLLFGSGWLPATWTPGVDPSAPSDWNQQQAIAILSGLGVLLAAVWSLAIWAAGRPGGYVVPAALGLVNAAAGVSILLSGNASGGLIALPFAGVAAGTLLVCLLASRTHPMTGVVGIGSVFLFGLLMGGRFFGELTTTNFALLIAAPLVCCIVLGLLSAQKFKLPLRFVIALVASLVPAGVAAGLAYKSFEAETNESSAYGSAAPADDAPVFSPATKTGVQDGATGVQGGAAKETSASQPANAATSSRDPGAEDAASEPKRSAPIDPGADSKN
jgi:hypothetical protein